MDQIVLAIECDPAQPAACAPVNTNELFETPTVFSLGGFGVNRAMLLMVLAALVVIAVLLVAYRRPRLVPTRFGAVVEGVVGYVRDEVAVGVIGPEGVRYFPYLLSLFLFILVCNLFGITPLINFPVTSRMAIPFFLALFTWFIFVIMGFARNGFGYLADIVWPRSVPLALRPLVGLIEFVSTFFLRPLTLAVRLFANMVAGHMLLSVLLVGGLIFIAEFDVKSILGVLWFAVGIPIFAFEIFVAVLQAYIFTLLAAVYVQTSLHPEH
ncbi:MAG: F0F1 ATP synthase subunit A [Actinomycetota bacterium]